MLAWGDGYAWESLEQSRIGIPIYFMSGNSPGFASEVISFAARVSAAARKKRQADDDADRPHPSSL
jgi:hypothetical protein